MTVYALDTETSGHDIRYHPDAFVMGVSLAWRDNGLNSEYYALDHIEYNHHSIAEVFEYLKDLLRNPENTIVFHNAKYDLEALRLLGLPHPVKWFDTMLMQHELNENLLSYSLDALSAKYFNDHKVKNPLMDAFINGPGWWAIPVWLIEPYAKKDAELTLRHFERLYPQWKKEGWE